MDSIVSVDLFSFFCLVVVLTAICLKKDKSKSSKVLAWVVVSCMMCLIVEAMSIILVRNTASDTWIKIIWSISFSGGAISLALFSYYCYIYISEKTFISRRWFYVPIVIVILDGLNIFYSAMTGRVFLVENGIATITGGLPIALVVIQIFFIVYLPTIAFMKRKEIGIDSVLLLGTFEIFPLIAALWSLIARGTDYSFAGSAMSIIFVYILLENRLAIEKEKKQNEELVFKNQQLEEQQQLLEESGCEQEAQIEEIRSLNEKLEENQARLQVRYDIIQSMSSIYFASYYIDLTNDTYIELKAKKSIKETIKDQGEAQASLRLACEKLIHPDYSQKMIEFTDLSTINQRLKDKNDVSCRYIGVTTGWSMAHLIAGDRDENGNLLHLFYAARMIHDEKAKEDAQIKKVQEYNEIIANAGLGIWYIILKDGVEPRMQPNDKMKELMGIVGMNLSEEDIYLWWHDRIVPEALESVNKSVDEMIGGGFSENTYLWEHPTLGKIYVRCGGTAQIKPNGTIVLSGYHADVTNIVLNEQKQKEELAVARQEAEAANEAKTSFLFNMSHDIRTPMNALMGFRELLEKNQEDPVKRADYLRKIDDASGVLLSIINNVLEMARIEKGTLEIDESVWSAEQFIDIIYSIFSEMMEQKGIEFKKEINVRHHYVYCDSIKLREVFINILSNAFKYTNSGGKVYMLLEELNCESDGWALYRTTITDTGVGMSQEFLPHIFEEFARESNSSGNKIEGTGLGMPIVKRLVEFMNGTVEVSSEKGVGSTFIVTIPHRIAEKKNLANHEGVDIDPTLFKDKRILLAEDNELNAEIAIEILTEAGFMVDHAEDGAICVDMLDKADDGYYNLVLMDIQMPNMNGYEATIGIRTLSDKEKAGIPIIAMTANAFEEDKRTAIRAGMNGHLAKPININLLLKELSRVLR